MRLQLGVQRGRQLQPADGPVRMFAGRDRREMRPLSAPLGVDTARDQRGSGHGRRLFRMRHVHAFSSGRDRRSVRQTVPDIQRIRSNGNDFKRQTVAFR